MVQQATVYRREKHDIHPSEMLGLVIMNIRGLDQSINELATLLRKGYIVAGKVTEMEEVLEERKTVRIYLQKTLLQLGGLNYMIPYWSLEQ